jgi:hypothetical protein
MIQKTIIIEDRPKRQENLLPNGLSDVEAISNLEHISLPQESDCTSIISLIENDAFEDFHQFNLIIIHRSSLTTTGLKNLNSFCSSNDKKLILYTGAQSTATYLEKPFTLLMVSANQLYSDNLLSFLSKYSTDKETNLCELLYGENWKLSLMLTYRQLLLDKKHGDDFLDFPDKQKLFDSCLSVLGNSTLEDTSLLINKKFNNI